jgi:phage-related minor tail protein
MRNEDMSEQIEELVLSVRADTRGFARDVAAMRGELEGPLAGGVERAGRTIENALLRAVRNGKMGFDDLKRVALTALGEIAAAALRAMLSPGGQGGGGQGLGAALAGLLGLTGGAPGRATGGPVSAGRAYLVGERGPELFVPHGGGRIVAGGGGGGRDVKVSIAVISPQQADPRLFERSGRQIARAVRRAVGEAR